MPIVLKSGNLNLLESFGPVQACNEIALPLPLPFHLQNRQMSFKDVKIIMFMLHISSRLQCICKKEYFEEGVYFIIFSSVPLALPV